MKYPLFHTCSVWINGRLLKRTNRKEFILQGKRKDFSTMIEQMLKQISQLYPLQERDTGEYQKVTVKPMRFQIRSFRAEGLGNVSVMSGKAMAGLMKMDTLIINPFEHDASLFSYDRIHAMGKDTLLLELYDTRISKEKSMREDGAVLDGLLTRYADIPQQPQPLGWMEPVHYPQSVKKAGKKLTSRFDEMTVSYLDIYLKYVGEAPACDPAEKKQAAKVYSEGLLEHGGLSTDQFVKAKGRAFTEDLFRRYLFGTEE